METILCSLLLLGGGNAAWSTEEDDPERNSDNGKVFESNGIRSKIVRGKFSIASGVLSALDSSC